MKLSKEEEALIKEKKELTYFAVKKVITDQAKYLNTIANDRSEPGGLRLLMCQVFVTCAKQLHDESARAARSRAVEMGEDMEDFDDRIKQIEGVADTMVRHFMDEHVSVKAVVWKDGKPLEEEC